MDLNLYYHIYLPNNDDENFNLIISQLQLLQSSNLLKNSILNIGIIYNNEEDLNKLKNIINKFDIYGNINILICTKNNGFELITAIHFKKYVDLLPQEKLNSTYILYFHTKGISKYKTQHWENSQYWRKYMEYFNITCWKECIKKLNEGYESCGVEWKPEFNGHYSGTFFWMKASLIKKINIEYFEEKFTLDRFCIEKLPGIFPHKHYNFYTSNKDLYYQPIYPMEYQNNIKIIYRISDTGYNKVKPDYINNENCLKNALEVFPWNEYDWSIIADNISEETNNMIQKYIPRDHINYVSVGHGAGTFNLALDEALQYGEDEIVYFIENDYLHKLNSDKILEEGFNLGASFVSLYDHPDKYLSPSQGGNPYCEGGAEETRVYLSKSTHWKITNSTTMTFAAKVSTLKRIEPILRKHTNTTHPNDFQMFLELRENNELLITPIPGYSTHGETAWLSPLTDWSKI
jgi:hypothetical protein